MFPHKVDANSSSIVPYLAGTCDRYLDASLELWLVVEDPLSLSHVLQLFTFSILSDQIVSVSGSSAIAILTALLLPVANTNSAARYSSTLPRNGRR